MATPETRAHVVWSRIRSAVLTNWPIKVLALVAAILLHAFLSDRAERAEPAPAPPGESSPRPDR